MAGRLSPAGTLPAVGSWRDQTGEQPRASGFEAAFHERTGLPVETMNPLARMAPSPKIDAELLEEVAPALGVGVGLALRRVEH